MKESQTELEERLDKVAKTVESYAIDAMFFCFCTQVVFAFFFIMFSDDKD
jgi:hypothetical protein